MSSMRRGVLHFIGLCALGTPACDIGRTSEPQVDPDDVIDPTDVGSNEDMGTEDLDTLPVERYGQLQVMNGQLLDADGDPVQLKGVSSMWLNWENDGYAENADALKWMRNNWNLTVIRASMGITPEGAYLSNSERARSQVETIVNNAIDAGVYVIIDWHDHAAHEHQTEAVEFFGAMAEKFGEHPNVIYEPYNEPLAVDWSGTVKPYHEQVVAAIRASDPDGIVILGTPNWSQDVDTAALDPVAGDNLMYTLHFYSCTHTASVRGKADRAVRAGLPLFVTEWGATDADGGTDGRLCLDAAATWLDWLNARQIGWTAWKLDNCAQDSSCLLTPDAPIAGGWTDPYLHGHAPFVRANMQASATPR